MNLGSVRNAAIFDRDVNLYAVISQQAGGRVYFGLTAELDAIDLLYDDIARTMLTYLMELT